MKHSSLSSDHNLKLLKYVLTPLGPLKPPRASNLRSLLAPVAAVGLSWAGSGGGADPAGRLNAGCERALRGGHVIFRERSQPAVLSVLHQSAVLSALASAPYATLRYALASVQTQTNYLQGCMRTVCCLKTLVSLVTTLTVFLERKKKERKKNF